MSIGETTLSSATVRRQVVRATVKPDVRKEFWQEKVFDLPKVNSSREAGIWAKLARLVKPANARSRCKLDDVMSEVTDRFALGGLIWEVAFRDLYLVSAPHGLCDRELHPEIEQGIARYLQEKLQGYFNSDESIRVRCLTSAAIDESEGETVHAYLGSTIFAPDRDTSPIGYLRYYPDAQNLSDWIEPVFADRTPAAVYRGQREIGFAVADMDQPVTLGAILDDPAREVWASVWGASYLSEKAGFVADFPTPRGQKESFLSVFSTEAAMDSEVDQSWSVAVGGSEFRPRGRLDLCLDSRPSRLWYKASSRSEAEFRIDELCFDLDQLGPDVTGICLDFDVFGRLVCSAMQTVKTSLLWKRQSNTPVYYHWGDGCEKAPSSCPTRVSLSRDGKVHFIGPSEAGNAGHVLGFLRPAANRRNVSFSPGIEGDGHYRLDWLDFSGAVFKGDRREGIATAYAKTKMENTVFPGCGEVFGKDLQIGPLVLRR